MWSKASTYQTAANIRKAKPTQKQHNTNSAAFNHFHGKASIFDLKANDKAKIGNLIRKCVELDSKYKLTEQSANERQTKLKKQVSALKQQNNEIIKQHSRLKSKFYESLKILRNYQMKLSTLSHASHKRTNNNNSKEQTQIKQITNEISALKQVIIDLQNTQTTNANANTNTRDSILICDNKNKNKQIKTNVFSPIQTPKLYQNPPIPHPYPSDKSQTLQNKTNLSLSQLRKFRIPSSNETSESISPKPISKKIRKVRHLNRNRLAQLLRIQSGRFEFKGEKTQNNNYKKCKNNMLTSASLQLLNASQNNMDFRRVQSEKGMSDDETDRLSVYDSLNLGISFPETEDENESDKEDEMLLIQHLNILPQ